MYRGERINSISHLVGAALGLIAWVLLAIFAALTQDGWKIVSCSVYGFTLFFMYLCSTLYHSFQGTPKKVFQRFDHIAIYLLIAGSYTPFTLVVLRPTTGWLIFGLVWGVATFGTVFKAVMGAKFNLVSTLLYVGCGWTIMLDIETLVLALPTAAVVWLFVGGALYTVGAGFFLKESMPGNHEIWHFFVLAASACHFVTIFGYVVPY